MIREIRQRYACVLIGAFALISQMLLPMVHAQIWAQQNGNPLLAAFCGQLSPALIARLSKAAPPELLEQIQSADHTKQDKLSCSLCSALHGQHLASSEPIVFSVSSNTNTNSAQTQGFAAPIVTLYVLPQLRAPPQIS